MRTKTVLLTAALGAVSIATAAAQTVYSVNAVGYVNVTVPAGKFALLANPLNLPTNSLAAVLPDVPANTTVVYPFNAATGAFDSTTKRTTGWTGTGAGALLNPGSGFFIKNGAATDITITFVGEVMQGTNLTVNVPAGFSCIGSMVPVEGKVETDLKIPAANGDVCYTFNVATGQYNGASTRRTAVGQWTGTPEPTIKVAEAFFYKAVSAGNWVRNFTVNQ
jgi:hypothetical protein